VSRRATVGDKSRGGETVDGLGHADLRNALYTYASTRADVACGRKVPADLIGGAGLKQWAASAYLLVIRSQTTKRGKLASHCEDGPLSHMNNASGAADISTKTRNCCPTITIRPKTRIVPPLNQRKPREFTVSDGRLYKVS